MPDRAPHDPAQHVTAAFVRGQHAVGDQKRRRTDVIRDDFLRRARVRLRTRKLRDCADQRPEDIDLVVIVGALHQRADALQAHAGIDTRRRQLRQGSVFRALELHEDNVPDFDPAIAVFFGRTRWPTVDAFRAVRVVVVEDFGAGTAGTGVAHRPEVVGRKGRALVVADADDAVNRQADLPVPDLERFIITLIDRHQQSRLVDAEPVFRGDEFPGEADRILLEVIAETEVAEHLEERVMPRRVADVLEIVVLAAGSDAALARRRARIRALFLAGEHVLELHHAGIGEQQGRVVARHQRRRRDNGMALTMEVFQEAGAEFVAGHGQTMHEKTRMVPRKASSSLEFVQS